MFCCIPCSKTLLSPAEYHWDFQSHLFSQFFVDCSRKRPSTCGFETCPKISDEKGLLFDVSIFLKSAYYRVFLEIFQKLPHLPYLRLVYIILGDIFLQYLIHYRNQHGLFLYLHYMIQNYIIFQKN